MSKKVKAAIIGPGNIGTDLLMKAMRSEYIEPVWMVGVEAESPGLKRATEMGLKTTSEGVDGMLPSMKADGVQICRMDHLTYLKADTRVSGKLLRLQPDLLHDLLADPGIGVTKRFRRQAEGDKHFLRIDLITFQRSRDDLGYCCN